MREQHLAAVPGGEEARHAVERAAGVVARAQLGGAGVQRHAHPQRAVEHSAAHDPRPASARWAASAAASASGALAKAAQTASPMVLKTTPPRVSIAWRSMASWRASAAGIAWGCRSHSAVLPSMSVNRKVTVPLGKRAVAARLLLNRWRGDRRADQSPARPAPL